MLFLELAGPSGRVLRFPLGERPLFIGRDASNDVVLVDETVSNRHASVWVRDGEIWVEDLKSTNGTALNGARVTGPVNAKAGDIVEVGRKGTRFSLVGELPQAFAHPVIEDVSAGLKQSIRQDRFVIGADRDADLRVEADESATLLVHATGEIWLDCAGSCEEIASGHEFTVGGHRFRVTFGTNAREATRHVRVTEARCTLKVTLDGPTGPEAVVSDDAAGRSHVVRAENRATLLYVLAKRFEEDTRQSLPGEIVGWCTDDEVVVGVWGRSSIDNPANSLHVLLNRVRAELKQAGIDPWFVEKRRGHVRVRVKGVVLS
jgi:pSer/pThr/pTyr-binding forkhead associated (FHA) protein